jgi:hypothetical protein
LSCTPASKRSGISPGYQSSTTTAGTRSAPPSPRPGNQWAAGADTGGCTLNSTAHVKCGELPGHVRCEDGSPEASLRRLVAGPLRRRASRQRRGRLNPEPPQACAAGRIALLAWRRFPGSVLTCRFVAFLCSYTPVAAWYLAAKSAGTRPHVSHHASMWYSDTHSLAAKHARL